MVNFTLRSYQESDLAAVKSLNKLGLSQMGIPLDGPLMDEDLNEIEKIYLEDRGEFLVAEYNGEIIGMGALQKIDDKTAAIKRMRVHPDFQRQGVGQAILNQLTHQARELGYKTLILDTLSTNFPAQNFYLKNSFQEYKREFRHNFERIYYQRLLQNGV